MKKCDQVLPMVLNIPIIKWTVQSRLLISSPGHFPGFPVNGKSFLWYSAPQTVSLRDWEKVGALSSALHSSITSQELLRKARSSSPWIHKAWACGKTPPVSNSPLQLLAMDTYPPNTVAASVLFSKNLTYWGVAGGGVMAEEAHCSPIRTFSLLKAFVFNQWMSPKETEWSLKIKFREADSIRWSLKSS